MLRVMAVMLLAFAGGSTYAQTYPNRPIRLVVPFVPGGTIDAYARALARQVESQIGQPIVIDNRAGANGIVGADTVAKCAPDGYTLLNNAASFVINASMYKRLPYDTANLFRCPRRLQIAVLSSARWRSARGREELVSG